MKRKTRLAIILSPAIILTLSMSFYYALVYIIALGLFSLAKVVYYSLKFNDCKAASESLKKEVIDAKKDLAKKGFKFET